jgi:uncharacterized protein (TIGR03435 family)
MMGTLLAALISCVYANGQTHDTHPAFEVASVKPAPPPVNGVDYSARGGPGTNDPGQITYPYTGLVALLMRAYGVGMDQISGPDWIHTEAYSIVAKIPPNTTKEQFNLMLQNMLAERFHLSLHHGAKDFPVYELSVAGGGPKMKPSPAGADAVPAPTAGPAGRLPTGENGFPVLPPGRTSALGVTYPRGAEGTAVNGLARATYKMTMAEFAESLRFTVNMANGPWMGGPVPRVVDKTGLTGKFDFTLEFAVPSAVRSSQLPPAVLRRRQEGCAAAELRDRGRDAAERRGHGRRRQAGCGGSLQDRPLPKARIAISSSSFLLHATL